MALLSDWLALKPSWPDGARVWLDGPQVWLGTPADRGGQTNEHKKSPHFNGAAAMDVREGTYGTYAYVPGVGLRMVSD